jgi:hypothetical protein
MRYFTVFTRVALAAGFLPAGYVKIIGERFTDLHNNQPMGHYLEALHHTGYYYTFIGILQVTAAILILIPRTVILGVLIYLPIILNITILSMAVRFEGSLFTAPLMVLANVYLLCWHYDRVKFILPFKHATLFPETAKPATVKNNFHKIFFPLAFATVVVFVLIITHVYDLMPRNTLTDCQRQCANSDNPKACQVFCEHIHTNGQPLDQALDDYHKALKK